MRSQILILLLTFSGFLNAYAQLGSVSKESVPRLVVEYSLMDMPFSFYAGRTLNSTISDPSADMSFIRGLSYFSMRQSMQIYTGINRTAAWGIGLIPVFTERPALNMASQALMLSTYDFLVFSSGLPLIFQGWMHEEWHRAVMVTNYVNSYNPFSLFRKEDVSGSRGYHVAYVLDENLELMKSNSNADLVRMAAAGGEAQLSAVSSMQKQNFFYRQRLPQSMNYVLNILNVIDYMGLCSKKDMVTERSLEQIELEGEHQQLRDAKGFDFTSWTYDLFNPVSPYSDRGSHAYGNGYDRYIYGEKLNAMQYEWLAKQSRLAFINYFSPMNIFISGIPLKRLAAGRDIRGNFAFRYYPTSFGSDIGLDLYYQSTAYNLRIGTHIYQNYTHRFPGIDFEVFEKPMMLLDQFFLLTVQLNVGLQPKDQNFFTPEPSFTGFTEATLKWRASNTLYPFITFHGKTKGWVQGNPFLKANFGMSIGLSSRIP